MSISLGGRDRDDGRHFEPLELQKMIKELNDAGFSVIESVHTQDSLDVIQ